MVRSVDPMHEVEEGRRTRIVYIIDTLRSGGAERHLVRLVEGMNRVGRWDVSVYCLQRTGQFVRSMEEMGVEVAGPEEGWSRSPLAIGKAVLNLRSYLRRKEPTIAHCYLPTAGLLGALAARLAGVSHVVTTRRWVHGYLGRRLLEYRMVAAVMDRLSSHVIAVCETARLQAIDEGTPEGKITTVYNAIRPSDFRVTRKGTFAGYPIFGAVGELHTRKGHCCLIEAVPYVLERFPSALFLIVGEGPEELRLRDLAARLGVSDHVEFLGKRNDIAHLLSEFDIFVLPSMLEGMPNVVLEAMAAGVPVVGTSVGGVPELVQHRETGLLVEPGSSQALAAALMELAQDEALQQTLSRSAEEVVASRFSVQRELEETEAMYLGLLSPDHQPNRGTGAMPREVASQ